MRSSLPASPSSSSFSFSSSPSSSQSSSEFEYLDQLVLRLYNTMRFEYGVEVDNELLAAIDIAFAASASRGTPVLHRDTARTICDDLFIMGVHPTDYLSVLDACGYSSQKRATLIASDTASTRRKRPSASYRIFKKHGWNEISSGWTGIF